MHDSRPDPDDLAQLIKQTIQSIGGRFIYFVAPIKFMFLLKNANQLASYTAVSLPVAFGFERLRQLPAIGRLVGKYGTTVQEELQGGLQVADFCALHPQLQGKCDRVQEFVSSIIAAS